MKRYFPAIFSLAVILIILGIYNAAGVFQRKIVTKEIGEFWNNRPENIVKINIADGKTGKKFIVEEKDKIKNFLQILDGRTVTTSKDIKVGGMGFEFKVEMYFDDAKYVGITSLGGDFIRINSVGYNLSQPILSRDVRDFLETQLR